MMTIGRLSVLGIVGLALLLSGSPEMLKPISQPGVACPDELSPKEFVDRQLASIEDFELFTLSDFEPELASFAVLADAASSGAQIGIPIDRLDDRTLHKTVSLEARSLRSSDSRFVMAENGSPMDASLPRAPGSFQGRIHQNGSTMTESTVALYIKPERQLGDRPLSGFISGYIVTNRLSPETTDWHFIEPVRPLLLATGDRDDIELCLPPDPTTHIVYEAEQVTVDTVSAHGQMHPTGLQPGTTSTFKVDLEPAGQAKAIIQRFETPFVHGPTEFPVYATVVNDSLPEAGGEPVLSARIEFFIDNKKVDAVQKTVEDNDPVTVEFTFDRDDIDPQDPETRPLIGPHVLTVRGPGNAMKRFIRITQSPIQVDLDLQQASEPDFESIPLIAVADSGFHKLYSRDIQDKTWWEAQEEVLNLVDAFYGAQFNGLSFNIRALKAWTSENEGPGSTLSSGTPFNAYTLLCTFAQNAPSSSSDHHENPTGMENLPKEGEVLVHLFSGHHLGPIPGMEAVSDSGTLCGLSCSMVDSAVIGLAEGIGGFRSPVSDSCHGNLDPPVEFDPTAHHSVSQHAPIPDSPLSHKAYEATLYQRFLLTAHEIGHNLGANHSPMESSIMYTPLQSTIRFKLDSDSDEQNNRDEIKSCWSNCE